MQAPPASGDWHCPGCRDLQFARNAMCRRCGTSKPAETMSSSALAVIAPRMNAPGAAASLPGDWQCALCQEVNFGSRSTCRKCQNKKPEGTPAQQAAAIVAGNQMPGSAATGAIVGYVAPGSVATISPWAKQWDSGPVNGMLVGERDIPDWLQSKAISTSTLPALADGKVRSGSSSSDSAEGVTKEKKPRRTGTQSSAGSASDASTEERKKGKMGKEEKRRKKERKEEKRKKKQLKKEKKKERMKRRGGEKDEDVGSSDTGSGSGSGPVQNKKAASKPLAKRKPKRKKDLDVEEELALRQRQRERRQKRVVTLD